MSNLANHRPEPTRDLVGVSDQDILEFASSIMKNRIADESQLKEACVAAQYCNKLIGHYHREVFAVILLNNRHQFIGFEEVFTGGLNSATIDIKTLCCEVLKYHEAAACIVTHNHPSGYCVPSEADRSITKNIANAFNVLGIRFLDHIIVGGSEAYYSFFSSDYNSMSPS